MTGENRRTVVTAVVEALSKLQTARLTDAKVQPILHRVLGEGSKEILKDGSHWGTRDRLSE